jgi:outer membrane protein assembly factor BamB
MLIGLMGPGFARRIAAALAVGGLLVVMGCGGSRSGSDSSGSAGSAAGSAGTPTSLSGWPLFGRVPERTHYLPSRDRELDPPLRETWSINTHALIEFPPAIADGFAYVVNKYGNALAVRLSDRKVIWRIDTEPRDRGEPTDVTAPVYDSGTLYLAFLDGSLAAIDAATGKRRWERDLHTHLESSPLVVDGTLYIGTNGTNVVAMDATDGSIRWQFNSPEAIKASPSFHDGRVFVADYAGSMFALDAQTGKLAWSTDTTRAPPYGSGGFFSSPAIAFGHVYAARDDGTVFGFDEKTGRLAWSFPTGAAVYGSPALAKVAGTPPSVYIGSEGGRLYALGALDGKPRWSRDVGGPIPGTATVIGHTVYSSSFKTENTLGFDVRTHRKTFELNEAGYTPVVSDGKRLYLIGYYQLVGLEPSKR